MNRAQLVRRTRSMLRDFNESTFRLDDVHDYLNESIDRSIVIIPELDGMAYLEDDLDNVTHLPRTYHHLLAVYAAARCFEQDERFHQSTKLMNEYETKMHDLLADVKNGDIQILDVDGMPVGIKFVSDHVRDVYFNKPFIDRDNIPVDGAMHDLYFIDGGEE